MIGRTYAWYRVMACTKTTSSIGLSKYFAAVQPNPCILSMNEPCRTTASARSIEKGRSSKQALSIFFALTKSQMRSIMSLRLLKLAMTYVLVLSKHRATSCFSVENDPFVLSIILVCIDIQSVVSGYTGPTSVGKSINGSGLGDIRLEDHTEKVEYCSEGTF